MQKKKEEEEKSQKIMDRRLTSYSASCVLLYITNTGLKGKGMQSRWIVTISKSEFQCKIFPTAQ